MRIVAKTGKAYNQHDARQTQTSNGKFRPRASNLALAAVAAADLTIAEERLARVYAEAAGFAKPGDYRRWKCVPGAVFVMTGSGRHREDALTTTERIAQRLGWKPKTVANARCALKTQGVIEVLQCDRTRRAIVFVTDGKAGGKAGGKAVHAPRTSPRTSPPQEPSTEPPPIVGSRQAADRSGHGTGGPGTARAEPTTPRPERSAQAPTAPHIDVDDERTPTQERYERGRMWAACRACGHAWPYVPPDRYDDPDAAAEASVPACDHCGHDNPLLRGFDGVHRMVGPAGAEECSVCGDTDAGKLCYGPDGFEMAS